MSIQVVATQMCVIFIFILIGYFMASREELTPLTCKQLSGLIVNVCSPSLMITSVLSAEKSVTLKSLAVVMAAIILIFVIQILLGIFMGRILHAPENQWNHYNMMTVFGNLGFIGIPVALAVLGSGCMIYAAMFNLVFNILVYTYGMIVMTSQKEGGRERFDWKKLLNTGNLAAVISIIVYLADIQLPTIASTALTYMANTVTFLSVLVIGASVARLPLKSIFTEGRLYLFILIRMLAFPIAVALVMKRVFDDPMVVGLSVLMVAMPAANMPLMLAETYGQDTTLLSKGIVLSTLCSVVTITITAMFV
ncbi:MAG: AEC family transporter [Hespellia sp.]|nr:AEC family transporter [Hespellia sp.]